MLYNYIFIIFIYYIYKEIKFKRKHTLINQLGSILTPVSGWVNWIFLS